MWSKPVLGDGGDEGDDGEKTSNLVYVCPAAGVKNWKDS
jgi:hypothetical protein